MMKIEFSGSYDTLISKIPEKKLKKLAQATGEEMSKLGTDSIKAFEAANKILVVDVLDVKPHGMVVDARSFKDDMPDAGKTCFMNIEKLHEFLDPQKLATHFSTIVQNLADNAKQLK